MGEERYIYTDTKYDEELHRLTLQKKGLGYVDVGQEGGTLMVRGGDPLAQVYVATGRAACRSCVAAGVFTQEQLEGVLRQEMDPSFYYLGHTIFSAWGRKPVRGGET